MKKTTIVAAAFLATVSSVALAQAPSSPSTSTPPAVTKTQTDGTNLQQQVTTNLQNSGFTNVKVMPDKTVQGEELTVKNKAGKISIVDAKGDSANVTIEDVNQSNGVIQVIDTVLMPS